MASIIAPGQSSILGVASIRKVFRPDADGRPALVDPAVRGGFCRPRPLSLTKAELSRLPDQADRRVLSLLGGASPFTEAWGYVARYEPFPTPVCRMAVVGRDINVKAGEVVVTGLPAARHRILVLYNL
jgi:hypothetical protein